MNKNTKTILMCCGGIGVLIAVVAFISLASPNPSSPTTATEQVPEFSQSQLEVIDNKFDFGEIAMKDGDVTHPFTIENNGAEPVTIEKVFTSCMCTTANITDPLGESHGLFGMQGHRGLELDTSITIGPGEKASVQAIYDPAAHGPGGVGLAQRSIYLETNSAQNPRVELRFSATVTN